MTTGKNNKFWTGTVILLLIIIATSISLIWSGYSRSQPLEIALLPEQSFNGDIYIGGAVNNPGFYPWQEEDTIEDLVKAAGGITAHADSNMLTLHVNEVSEAYEPQKIDLNRAEAWLLEALPGIGETRAQAIIDYRQQNGPFRNINELTYVAGIGTATYEEIKHLITVND